jgi:hypothetical protein
VRIGIKCIPTIRAFPAGHCHTSLLLQASGRLILAPGFEVLIVREKIIA